MILTPIDLNGFSEVQKLDLDVSHLSSGIYFVKFTSGEMNLIERVVIVGK